jgi:hypothetical protein
MLVRSWPLSDFRLSHQRVQVALSVHWLWSPSLVGLRQLGVPFGTLAVLRDHPTSAVPSPPRPFVLGSYQWSPTGGRQISPGKGQKASREPVTNTYGRPADFGLRDWRLAYPRLARLTVLRFRSVPRCTYDFHQTAPRGAALVFCVGFLLPRFQKDFHLLLSAHAGRNPKRVLAVALPLLRARGDTNGAFRFVATCRRGRQNIARVIEVVTQAGNADAWHVPCRRRDHKNETAAPSNALNLLIVARVGTIDIVSHSK